MPEKKEKDPQTYAILGAAIEVHRQLGPGFTEAVYQAALEEELTARSIPFCREALISVMYKGKPLPCSYRADFICYEQVLVELKAITSLGDLEAAQIINYLRATGFSRGLLINFGQMRLQYKRFVQTQHHNPSDD